MAFLEPLGLLRVRLKSTRRRRPRFSCHKTSRGPEIKLLVAGRRKLSHRGGAEFPYPPYGPCGLHMGYEKPRIFMKINENPRKSNEMHQKARGVSKTRTVNCRSGAQKSDSGCFSSKKIRNRAGDVTRSSSDANRWPWCHNRVPKSFCARDATFVGFSDTTGSGRN